MSHDVPGSQAPLLEGRYANVLRVGFNAQEFLIDFGQLLQGEPAVDHGREQYFTRIVVVPTNMKRFLTVLRQAVGSYENTFAIIPDPDASIDAAGPRS